MYKFRSLHEYKPKRGYISTYCEYHKMICICGQHHLVQGSGRTTSKVIDVCNEAHEIINNPSAFGLASDWSYINGFLVKNFKLNYLQNGMLQKKKTKSCSHSKSMYDFRLGYIKCTFCGHRMDEIKYGTSKVKEVKETTEPKTKMGYEKQDPRIKEAENLKKSALALKVILKKKSGSPLELSMATKELKDIQQQMKDLQESYT